LSSNSLSLDSLSLDALPLDTLSSRQKTVPEAPKEKAPFLTKKGLLQRRMPSGIRSWAAVPLASSLPLCLLGGIWLWSANLSSTPAALQSLLHLQPSDVPHVAPIGVEVVDLSSSFVTLDSGKRILEIRGSVLNATARSFDRVKLEAKVFNRENQELGRVITDSRSGLAEANIEALSPEALEEMQMQGPSSLSPLRPNEKVPFLIVVPQSTAEDLSAVRWFSTRVYSTESIVDS
jgi:hypothetical protein